MENLRREMKDRQNEIDEERQQADRRLKTLHLQLQERTREDEEEVLEKIDLLESLQKECVEEKAKILHDFQKLVQNKDYLCSEYERNLLKLLKPLNNKSDNAPPHPPPSTTA